MIASTLRCQTTARQGLGVLRLPVKSPYFVPKRLTRQTAKAGRNTNLFLAYMDALIVELYVVSGVPEIVISFFDSSTGTPDSTQVLPMTWANLKANGFPATVLAAINTYLSGRSLTLGTTEWFGAGMPAGLVTAPQAAIAAAVTNLATNYNLATGILGLANALNTANGAQNDLGTKFNSLVSELVSLGLIHA